LTSDPAAIDPALKGKKVSTIIWTTTPWTLPASMAVAFHPDLEYVVVEGEGECYIIATERLMDTLKAIGWEHPVIRARFPGRKLEYATFAHPFLDRKIVGVLADYVTTDQGTGAVHTAPSHGADDFYTGTRYKLDQTCNVDEAGRMRNGLPEYEGKTVFQANEPIIELLKQRGVLMAQSKLEHSYPHCWRCHNPVIFRATEQWFIGMESPLEGSTLRQRALDEIKKVKWDPAWGEERISNMIATRPDWCISRQRVWGVPIAVFFCSCGELLRSPEVNRTVVALFAREGADAWYKHDAKEIVPAGTKCSKCGGSDFRKEMDILDVWFESGSSHAAVLGREPGLPWPADLYLEGSDQYRGWFHSSLLCAVGSRNQAPYRMVATNGWTLDEEGRAMSKSLGNGVDPVDIANRKGGEIVRLWVASVDFREDVHASEGLMTRVAENYVKIRNTFRNMLQNLYDFNPAEHAIEFAKLEPLDRYLLILTADLTKQFRQWYEEFAFHKIYQRLNQFCVVELSSFYFEVLKDRLYTAAPNSQARRSAQTALWRIATTLIKLTAPILTFTAEEAWQYLPGAKESLASVHLAQFPATEEVTGASNWDNQEFRDDWGLLLSVREAALNAMEEVRKGKVIGRSEEAQVKISAPAQVSKALERYRDGHLRELLKVSGVEFEEAASGNGATGIRVEVARAQGTKCERCWTYSTHVGEDKQYPTVCERCSSALGENGLGK
jgi:isoleucyl-tRNA synthetase